MPSLGNLLNWAKTEGGNAVSLLLIGFGLYFLWKKDFGKMVGFLLAGGAVYFIIQNPTVVSTALGKLAELLF